MYKEKTFLGVIPARGGSKGVPRKNIRLLGNRPLLAWTIDAASRSQYLDRFILSSEDGEIIDIARTYGCDVPFVRPRALAEDTSSGAAPAIHALNALSESYDYLVLLQPTSPFRTAEDIDAAIGLCVDKLAIACVSVKEVEENPAWMYRVDDHGLMMPYNDDETITDCRQQLSRVYLLNGAVYVVETSVLLESEKFYFPGKTVAYPMSKENSLDIDTEYDFKLCEYVAAGRHDKD